MGAVRERGFTYLGVLFFVAAVGVALAAVGTLWATAQQREKERELLFVGEQFRRAIGLYYERSPGAAKRYPRTLEELLHDPRQPTIQRYLRKLYRDPLTGSATWGLVEAPSGGIMGVFSLSEGEPLKSAGFRLADREFEGKTKYSEWKFVYVPQGSVGTKPPLSGIRLR